MPSTPLILSASSITEEGIFFPFETARFAINSAAHPLLPFRNFRYSAFTFSSIISGSLGAGNSGSSRVLGRYVLAMSRISSPYPESRSNCSNCLSPLRMTCGWVFERLLPSEPVTPLIADHPSASLSKKTIHGTSPKAFRASTAFCSCSLFIPSRSISEIPAPAHEASSKGRSICGMAILSAVPSTKIAIRAKNSSPRGLST